VQRLAFREGQELARELGAALGGAQRRLGALAREVVRGAAADQLELVGEQLQDVAEVVDPLVQPVGDLQDEGQEGRSENWARLLPQSSTWATPREL